MAGRTQKKFYRPGTYSTKGTKLALKTRPIVNDIIFNTQDPISSFQAYLSTIKCIINDYERLVNIPGIRDAVPGLAQVSEDKIARCGLLLDFLVQSPTEITLKSQMVDDELLATVEAIYNDRDE